MLKKKIGIIGNGFVGEAQAFAFSTISHTFIYDIDPLKSKDELSAIHSCDFVFVCVPTPMHVDGSQDLSFVESVFKNSSNKPIYILKSTVLPGTCEDLIKKFPKLNLVFSPEFLTERTSKLDMLTQSRIILGGNETLVNKVEKLFKLRFKNKNIIKTGYRTAELIKYMNNSFATRLVL